MSPNLGCKSYICCNSSQEQSRRIHHQLYRPRYGRLSRVGFIPAGGHIVDDEFFSTVLAFRDVYDFHLNFKTHLPSVETINSRSKLLEFLRFFQSKQRLLTLAKNLKVKFIKIYT